MPTLMRKSPGSRANRLLPAAVFLLSLTPVAASAVPTSERLAYTVMLGGLHVGDAVVDFHETDSGYKAGVRMMASGALRWVKDFRTSMEGEGAVASPGKPIPGRFHRDWTAGAFAETLSLQFDPATRVASAEDRVFNPVTGAGLTHEDLPWNKHTPLKPVPANLRTNVFDPIAAFIAARDQLIAEGALKEPRSFRVPVFDGTRRYDIVGKTEPVRTVSINGMDREALPVSGKLVPVFGFTKDGEERFQKITSKILFTPDARFLPIQMVVSAEFFSVVMNLVTDCRDNPAACDVIDGGEGQRARAN